MLLGIVDSQQNSGFCSLTAVLYSPNGTVPLFLPQKLPLRKRLRQTYVPDCQKQGLDTVFLTEKKMSEYLGLT
jgi:hypothetical protein